MSTQQLAARDWSQWTCDCRLVITDSKRIDDAMEITAAILEKVGKACSNYRPDAELSAVAASLPGPVTVSDTLAKLLRAALRAARRTEGLVTPVPESGSTWRQLHLVDEQLTAPAGTRFDLGATGKAVAADWCAAALTSRLGGGALVSLGGDIATSGTAPEDGWQVLVQDMPTDPTSCISLPDGWAVATSSTQRRRRNEHGSSRHHITDPRTGKGASDAYRTVSVAAPSCELANTLSTAAIVLADEAPTWLQAQQYPARLVTSEGSLLHIGGWPRNEASDA